MNIKVQMLLHEFSVINTKGTNFNLVKLVLGVGYHSGNLAIYIGADEVISTQSVTRHSDD